MDTIIRVVVVDDSAYMRKVVKEMLERSPFIQVVGSARDGVEALECVARLQPNVVTLDLIMPEMDGVTFLRKQMALKPIPVVVLSIAGEAGEMALSALDAGAVDFVQKPTALATERNFEISEELIAKVKSAANVKNLRPPPPIPIPPAPEAAATAQRPLVGAVDMVVIGISTGGPQGLKLVIPLLPVDLPVPVAIVLHMPVGYTELYAQKLNDVSRLEVIEAKEGDLVRPGRVLLAPAGRHLTFRRNPEGQIVAHLDVHPLEMLHRPAVDVLFQSAAEMYGSRVLGVVMTGMGSDGKQGSAWIKSQGGTVLTEAESTCVVYGMPRSVVEAGLSDAAVPINDMARAITDLVCEEKRSND